jgi:hypothetical protein
LDALPAKSLNLFGFALHLLRLRRATLYPAELRVLGGGPLEARV